ncbi:MAG: hypothetical protein SCH71_16945 [Desulfobulbaceae bacterium]|nr:hypothetical protein [Desulfobulbaceae bacterium]
MKNLSIPFLLISIATVSYAEPVYLKCIYPVSEKTGLAGETRSVNITIDESNGQVTYTHFNGEVNIYIGFFSANEVKFQDITSDYIGHAKITTSQSWIINRQDLSIQKTNTMEFEDTDKFEPDDAMTTIKSVNEGKCEIITVKDRKF